MNVLVRTPHAAAGCTSAERACNILDQIYMWLAAVVAVAVDVVQ